MEKRRNKQHQEAEIIAPRADSTGTNDAGTNDTRVKEANKITDKTADKVKVANARRMPPIIDHAQNTRGSAAADPAAQEPAAHSFTGRGLVDRLRHRLATLAYRLGLVLLITGVLGGIFFAVWQTREPIWSELTAWVRPVPFAANRANDTDESAAADATQMSVPPDTPDAGIPDNDKAQAGLQNQPPATSPTNAQPPGQPTGSRQDQNQTGNRLPDRPNDGNDGQGETLAARRVLLLDFLIILQQGQPFEDRLPILQKNGVLTPQELALFTPHAANGVPDRPRLLRQHQALRALVMVVQPTGQSTPVFIDWLRRHAGGLVTIRRVDAGEIDPDWYQLDQLMLAGAMPEAARILTLLVREVNTGRRDFAGHPLSGAARLALVQLRDDVQAFVDIDLVRQAIYRTHDAGERP